MATKQQTLGEWYTPQHINTYAQNKLSEINAEWRNSLVVDPACGHANLTRDYSFQDLVLSTIRPEDVQDIKDNNYNEGAEVYTLNFLDDDLPEGMIEKLKSAKDITWYMNPPYGTAGAAGATGKNKAGINKNKINTEMKESKLIGRAAQQLYVGFLWRITKLMKEYNLRGRVAMFTNSIFMAGGSYKKFRKWWCGQWKFEEGAIFPATEFGCQGKWPVAYTIWEYGDAGKSDDFVLDVVEHGKKIGTQNFYNTDDKTSLSEWIKTTRKTKKADGPLQSAGLGFKEKGYGSCYQGMLGDMYNNANNILSNTQAVALYSSGNSSAHNQTIFPDNFFRCLVNFVARKLIQDNWIEHQMEYIAPEKVDGPLQSSGLRFKDKGYGSCYQDMLGDMYNSANNITENAQSVSLFSSGYSGAHNQTLFPDNFLRCLVCLTARGIIDPNWINQKSEYIAPEKVDGPLQSSGLKFKEKGRGSCYKNMVGDMLNVGNNILSNTTSVSLFSSGYSSANNQTIFPSNFFRCIVCFTARKLIMPTWINQKLEYIAPEKVDGPHQTSGLKFKETGTYDKQYNKIGQVGYLCNDSNNIMANTQGVVLTSVAYAAGHQAYPIFPSNFFRCLVCFTARKLIQDNWIENQMEYIAPQPSGLAQFAADSIAYSLFEPKNNMTAVRDVEHKDKFYSIPNNLFWHDKEQILPLAYPKMLHDLEHDQCFPHLPKYFCSFNNEYYVIIDDDKIVDEPTLVKLSPQAQKVMQLVDKLWLDSLEKREEYALEHPEYHLDSWNAGYYQLKYLWREHFKEQHDEFRDAYKELSDYLRPQVYELGMLKEGYVENHKEKTS